MYIIMAEKMQFQDTNIFLLIKSTTTLLHKYYFFVHDLHLHVHVHVHEPAILQTIASRVKDTSHLLLKDCHSLKIN